MAVGLFFDGVGVTQAQCDQVRTTVLPGDRLAPGMLSFAAGPSDVGWCVVTIWESDEAVQRFFAAELGPALQRAGIAIQPRRFQVLTALGYQAAIGAAGTPIAAE